MYQTLVLTFLSYLDAQGFRRFLRTSWNPFEVQFQSIETQFIHYTDMVVCIAGAEHQIHFYQEEVRKQEGECYRYRLLLIKLT